MPDRPLRLLILGAHPDDAEFHAGGLAAIYRRLGHVVKMVSVTSGDAGHHVLGGPELAARRRLEAAAAGEVIGAEYITWDNHDGVLLPTLDVRYQIIREIRRFEPDLVLTHRTNDYHPDHRAVGHAVRDASYMVTVPNVLPEVPILRKDPVVAYMADRFTKPCPLQPDVLIDASDHLETVVEMLSCHVSQMFEWLPYNQQIEDKVPRGHDERRAWLRQWFLAHRAGPMTERFRPQLIERFGPDRGRRIVYAEAYELSEYAAPLNDSAQKHLFPTGA
ncbi:MAG: PIG-L family deacetylase [Planctomycetia bacterium]|nr:PIG-L family deacetylase [Planctomycetia bacterium]